MPQEPRQTPQLLTIPKPGERVPLDPTPLAKTNPGLARLVDFLGGLTGLKDALTPESSTATVVGAGLSSLLPVIGAVGGGLKKVAAPIKAYHGSPHDFDKFDISKAGSTTDRGLLGKGLYFSTDENVATTRPHRYEVELGIQNPLSVKIDKWESNKTEAVTKALGIHADSSADDITKAVKAKGFDSVVLDYSPLGYKKQEIAVFDDAIIDIMKKYGFPLATAAAMQSYMRDQQKKKGQ